MRRTSFFALASLLALTLAPTARAGGGPELCATGGDLIVTHTFGDPLSQSYTITHCGDSGTRNWSAGVVGAVDAIASLDVESGTITEVGGSVTINLVFDYTVAPGAYNGAIRFFKDGDSVSLFLIQINFQKTELEVGQSATGDLQVVAEREAGAVGALDGLKVKFRFIPDDPSLRARITIADENGVILKSWKTKKPKGSKLRVTKKKATVTGSSSGLYAMFVEVIAGSGTYTVETSRGKLPKTAKSRLLTKLSAPTGSDTVEVQVGAFAGAIMNANVVAGGGTDINALTIDLVDPSGATQNTGPFESTSDVAFHLLQVPLADLGMYTIRISGLTSTDKVDVPVTPYQPDAPTGTVSIDT